MVSPRVYRNRAKKSNAANVMLRIEGTHGRLSDARLTIANHDTYLTEAERIALRLMGKPRDPPAPRPKPTIRKFSWEDP